MPAFRFHESLQRGSPDFPLEYYHLDKSHSRYEMSFHWHEEVELIRVISGAFSLSIDENSFLLPPGAVAFIPSGCLHGGTPENAEYECVVLDMRFLLKSSEACRSMIGDILHRRLDVFPLFPADSEAARAISPLFDALKNNAPGAELIATGSLMHFFGEIYRLHLYQEAPAGEDCRRVLQLKKVFELIESEYASPLSLSSLAECVHMTPKYFCRFFKQAVHRSPMDYLNYYRVEMACYALAATEKNVTEVALDTGFNDPAYFIRTFRHFKGETPGRYAARMRRST